MSLQRKTTEQTASNWSPSRSSTGRESSHRWRLLSRPWLKYRSNSAPEEPLDAQDRRILVGRELRTQSMTWSTTSRTAPTNPPISRVHSLPDAKSVTSCGVLMENANVHRDWLSRSSIPYLRSASVSGGEILTETPPLGREQTSLTFSGILMSLSRRISRILNAPPEAGEATDDGRRFD